MLDEAVVGYGGDVALVVVDEDEDEAVEAAAGVEGARDSREAVNV